MSRAPAPSAADTDLFVALANVAPTMLWMTGTDAGCVFANNPWLEFTGRTLDQELGSGWAEAIHPDDRQRAVDCYLAAFESRQPVSMQLRIRAADGSYRWILDCGAPRFTLDGRFAGYIGSCLDITHRKQIEEALQESEERFHTLAAHVQDAIYRYRFLPQRRMEYASPAIFRITGHTPEEFYADPDLMLKIIVPDDRPLLAQMSDGPNFRESALLRWMHPGGQVVWAEHRHVPLFDEHGRIVAVDGIARDVTESLTTQERMRGSESQLRRLAAALQNARERERAFVARELHDGLGQSLTSVQLEIARVTQALVAARVHKPMIDRLQSLVGLVEVATETVRRISTELRPPALDHLGLAAAIELEAGAMERRTALRIRVRSCSKESRLTQDQSTALFRIFQEVLTNIVRHAGASTVRVRLTETARTFTLKIEDNGRGITSEELTAPSSIGLLGMRERAQPLGGTIEIIGAPGKGTTVTIVMPIVPHGRVPRTRPLQPRRAASNGSRPSRR
jgi:PAS domain S-box-containing protein